MKRKSIRIVIPMASWIVFEYPLKLRQPRVTERILNFEAIPDSGSHRNPWPSGLTKTARPVCFDKSNMPQLDGQTQP
jgi:hypothetical protein